MPQVALRKRPVTVSPNGTGVATPRGVGMIWRDSFFQYAANFTFVTNETQQTTIPIQADAHFLCVMSMYDTSAAAGASGGTVVAAGGTTVQLQDVAGQRFLSSIAVPASCLFGTAREPYVWPFTHIFRANGGIILIVTGTTGAPQTVRFVFAGFKVPIGHVPQLDNPASTIAAGGG